ncbi:MAG: hypothetical protein ACJ796_20595 [Gemmatimonadaceae bacterium]
MMPRFDACASVSHSRTGLERGSSRAFADAIDDVVGTSHLNLFLIGVDGKPTGGRSSLPSGANAVPSTAPSAYTSQLQRRIERNRLQASNRFAQSLRLTSPKGFDVE